ncbi:hypothetical protein WJX81_007728 [Elliptochloris bilobata]|uniref:non-specific serine/threonine protein kinase n=1 Tax=Elliptochloris bilobata TaxID=381761 RepID=A0AAW1R3Z2_9CHLO
MARAGAAALDYAPPLLDSGPGALLVSLLDGTLVALDPLTGAELWAEPFDSGKPLIRSVPAAPSGTPAAPGGNPGEGTPAGGLAAVFPGLDGVLYAYADGGGGDTGEARKRGLQRLATRVEDLARRGPEVALLDGSTVMSSHEDFTYHLDPASGTLLRAAAAAGGDLAQLDTAQQVDSPLRIGRRDHTVHVLDASGRPLWNVTYSRMRPIAAAQPAAESISPILEAVAGGASPTGIVAGPHNTLQRRHPRTGELVVVASLGSSLYALPAVAGTNSAAMTAAIASGEGGSGVGGGAGVLVPARPQVQAQARAQDTGKGLLLLRPQPSVPATLDCGLRCPPLGAHPVLPARESVGSCAPRRRSLRTRVALVLARYLVGMLVGGTAVLWVAAWYYLRKPRVIGSMQHHADGVTTMKLAYTGTQQSAAEARASARAHDWQDAGDAPPSLIRDHTGSGVENIPEHAAAPSGKGRRRKARNPRFSNRLNGVLQLAATNGNGVARDREEEEGDENGCEPPAGASGTPGDAQQAVAAAAQPTPRRGDRPVRAREETGRKGVCRVGRMEVGPEILGYGSSGTLVFEGTLDGRPIAVKRLLRQFYELAHKEISALIVSDEHPNIVRCFAMEEDAEFVYLALERCRQSLHDLMAVPSAERHFVDEHRRPTSFCMQVAMEAGRGLVALHERGIVHRDIKPQNVLLTEGRRAKLSDMGLCRRMAADQSSFESLGPGGSSGWQAPEQLISRSGGDARQGRGTDVFSYGLLLHYCLSGGRHAFGESYERDSNILQARCNLKTIAHLPEAEHLVRAMLAAAPKRRPGAEAVMAHPFFWPSGKQLAFLVALSDRVECEDREEDQTLLAALEAVSEEALGGRNWQARLDAELLGNLGRYRRYRGSSLRDLLRVIRNKHNHWRELPEALQQRLGPPSDGFLLYFKDRFPRLLLTTFCFALRHCSREPAFAPYLPPAAAEFPFQTPAGAAARAAERNALSGAAAHRAVPASVQAEQQARTSSTPLPGAAAKPALTAILEQEADRTRSAPELLAPTDALPPDGPPSGGSSQGSSSANASTNSGTGTGTGSSTGSGLPTARGAASAMRP